MRNPKHAKMHLMKAHQAVKDGDGVKARHHVGHAFSALKEGPLLESAPETRSAKTMAPPVSSPQSATPIRPPMSLKDRLKAMHQK